MDSAIGVGDVVGEMHTGAKGIRAGGHDGAVACGRFRAAIPGRAARDDEHGNVFHFPTPNKARIGALLATATGFTGTAP